MQHHLITLPSRTLPLTGLTLILVMCSFFSGRGPVQSHPATKETPISKTVQARDLLKKLPAEKWNDFYLDAYMVKSTSDPNKKDFEMVLVLRNDKQEEIYLTPGFNKGTFSKKAAAYTSYLHQKGVALKDYPSSYVIRLTRKELEGKKVLTIGLPSSGEAALHTVSLKAYAAFGKDTLPICLCPPGPCTGCPNSFSSPAFSVMQSALQKKVKETNHR